jgi:hypothetical protein
MNPPARGGAVALARSQAELEAELKAQSQAPSQARAAAKAPAKARASLRTVRSPERLEALLGDLGPQLRRGGRPLEPLPHHPSGIDSIDDLLGGGFPGHRLSEVVGPPSSGRTSIALALLATTTRAAGELTAVVDRADAFDPTSAEAAGVDLERVLWARVEQERPALRCVERLLETGGIPLVVLDLGARSRSTPEPRRGRSGPAPASALSAIPATVWTRLARCAAETRTALVILTPERVTGSQAEVVLEMQPTRPRWSGTPGLLEQLETRAVLLRHRTAPAHRAVTLRLGGRRP